MGKPLVISLGGSLIVPDKIDEEFLKKFRSLIFKYVDKGSRFFIVAGGGKTCRLYQDAARKISDLADEDLDWIGIHVTHLNAQLLHSIFRENSHKKVLTHYDQKEEVNEPIVIGAGWKPGHSTDYDAVMFANLYDADTIVNLSDVPFVYDKDPDKSPDAQPFENLGWENYRQIVGSKWVPGDNLPFDPVASKKAEGTGLKVVIMDGHKLENFENYLEGKSYSATTIS